MKRLKKWLIEPRPVSLSREEVRQTIVAFIEGRGGAYDWDDFLSFPLQDPELEAVRKRCIEIEDEFPRRHPREWTSPEGVESLREIAEKLAE